VTLDRAIHVDVFICVFNRYNKTCSEYAVKKYTHSRYLLAYLLEYFQHVLRMCAGECVLKSYYLLFFCVVKFELAYSNRELTKADPQCLHFEGDLKNC